MAIESISNDVAASYRTTDVSSAAKPEFQTAEPAQVNVATTTNGVDYAGTDDRQKGNTPSESTVKQAISDINKKINPNTIAEYGYHEETNRVTIKIVDKDSDKTIKEFPAEETLDMIAKVWELAGMFLDEKG